MENLRFDIINKVVEQLLNQYADYLTEAEDEVAYSATVLGALIFRELILFEFKKTVIKADNMEDIEELVGFMEGKAKQMAGIIDRKTFKDVRN